MNDKSYTLLESRETNSNIFQTRWKRECLTSLRDMRKGRGATNQTEFEMSCLYMMITAMVISCVVEKLIGLDGFLRASKICY